MTVFVTGGAGFIGSNFIFHLLRQYPDYHVVCLDKLNSAANIHTLDAIIENPNFSFVKVDICDRERIFDLFAEKKPDIVVNFAAESHVDKSIETPQIFFETNVIGTMVLLDACVKYGVKKFHQVSTDEVYGELPIDRKDLFFTEKTNLNPQNPYSASKASADLLCMAYRHTYKVFVTVSRSCNNYGPYQFTEKLIPLAITNAICDKEIPIYGEGINVRDWIYVDDHCKAIDLIIHNGKDGEIYNVGASNEMQNIDVAKAICKALDKPSTLIKYVKDRKGHDMRYAIDATKIKNELGWESEVSFADGLKKTVEWYKSHRDWWGKGE